MIRFREDGDGAGLHDERENRSAEEHDQEGGRTQATVRYGNRTLALSAEAPSPPAPISAVSLPRPPMIVSLPSPPSSRSAPSPPVIVSLPAPPSTVIEVRVDVLFDSRSEAAATVNSELAHGTVSAAFNPLKEKIKAALEQALDGHDRPAAVALLKQHVIAGGRETWKIVIGGIGRFLFQNFRKTRKHLIQLGARGLDDGINGWRMV